MKTAFKEWAAVCRALGLGEQIVILRKGGIVEAGGTFRVEHPEFLLFPTFLHQSPDSLIPAARHLLEEARAEMPNAGEIVFRNYARVTDHFRIQSAEELRRLRGFHVWSDAVVEERFHRWQKSLHVLLVRVYALPQPTTIPQRDEYAGCKSWVDLDVDVSVNRAEPVIFEERYRRRTDEICSALRDSR
ncbi:MAG: DUF1802 family protein [Deltaproteobacteria bacterium]